jgi:hypothetical protein
MSFSKSEVPGIASVIFEAEIKLELRGVLLDVKLFGNAMRTKTNNIFCKIFSVKVVKQWGFLSHLI